MPPQSSPPIPKRPQTSRAVRRAYNKRGGPTISEAERRRIERGALLEERAAKIREKEQKKKENKRKKEEKEEREKEKRRRMGIKEVAKVEEGQMRIGLFLKKPSDCPVKEGGHIDANGEDPIATERPVSESVPREEEETRGISHHVQAPPRTDSEDQEEENLIDAHERENAKPGIRLQPPPESLSSTTTLIGDTLSEDFEPLIEDRTKLAGGIESQEKLHPRSQATNDVLDRPSSCKSASPDLKRKRTNDKDDDSPRKRLITTCEASSQVSPMQRSESRQSSPVPFPQTLARQRSRSPKVHKQEAINAMPPPSRPKPRSLLLQDYSLDDSWSDFFQSNTQIAREITTSAEEARLPSSKGWPQSAREEARSTSKIRLAGEPSIKSAKERHLKSANEISHVTTGIGKPWAGRGPRFDCANKGQGDFVHISSHLAQETRPCPSATSIMKSPSRAVSRTPSPAHSTRTPTISSRTALSTSSRVQKPVTKPVLVPMDKHDIDKLLSGISTQDLFNLDGSSVSPNVVTPKTSATSTSAPSVRSWHPGPVIKKQSSQQDICESQSNSNAKSWSKRRFSAPGHETSGHALGNPLEEVHRPNKTEVKTLSSSSTREDMGLQGKPPAPLTATTNDNLDDLDWSLSSQDFAVLDQAANSTRTGTETPTSHVEARRDTTEPPALADSFDSFLSGISSQELVELCA